MGEEKALSWAEMKKQINKTYGQNSVGLGKDLPFLGEIPRIPTGIFNLDLALGGGIPVGRTTQLYGDPGSCKTTICLRTVANAQKLCRYCFKRAHSGKTDHAFRFGGDECQPRNDQQSLKLSGALSFGAPLDNFYTFLQKT